MFKNIFLFPYYINTKETDKKIILWRLGPHLHANYLLSMVHENESSATEYTKGNTYALSFPF